MFRSAVEQVSKREDLAAGRWQSHVAALSLLLNRQAGQAVRTVCDWPCAGVGCRTPGAILAVESQQRQNAEDSYEYVTK